MVKSLLIVDDQAMYLKSLELALKDKYKIFLASELYQSLKILNDETCEIALVDIRLDEEDSSNIDGLKILEWIKMNKPQVSTFMMSAYHEFLYAEKALNLGAKHFFKSQLTSTA